MSGLSQLFAVFDRMPADELRLTSGENPYIVSGGQKRPIASSPMNTRLILATASEVLTQEELADLPAQRPRVVRHEHNGETWLVEVARVSGGMTLAVRRARAVVTRMEQRHESQEVAVQEIREAVGAGPMRAQFTRPTVAPPIAVPAFAPASSPSPAPSHAAAPPVSAPAFTPPSARGHDSATHPRAVAGRSAIDALLRKMIAASASDLHLSAGSPPVMRVHGEIHFGDAEALSSSEIEALVRAIMTPKAQGDFAELRDADFAYEVPGLARFRVNVFEDRRGVGAVLRQIPIEIKTAEQLGLPKACTDLCWLSKGLVLVTGPTGSGKSTTLAAMIDFINKNRADHIITIEDPVEFVHPNQKCLVNQREVGQHTKSFKGALRAALREDPDIVMVGEMRDLETIAIAIETAETGHLVFGTLHTTTAVSTVDRIIDQFPTDRQAQIRVMLSESLKGVVAQGLCKKIGGGRIAAHEILLGTPAVSALVRDGKTFQLPSVMQTGKAHGMVTMNDSLFSLVHRKLVDPKEAYVKAVDKAGLLGMYRGAGIPFAI